CPPESSTRDVSGTAIARRSIRGSIMAELNRNLAGAPFRGRVSSAEAAAIDAGLRAYMVRVYNYMGLGLAITGIAAYGIYLLSVTGDAAEAAKIARGGTETAARLGNGSLYLTPIGYAVFVSPLKWAVFLSPLAVVFGLSFGIERLR